MKRGYDVFGKAYGVMLRNDVHAVESIDHAFMREMILLDEESYEALYHAPVYTEELSGHALYAFSEGFRRETDRASIEAVLQHTSNIAAGYDVPFEEMQFGGTEQEILERGTDWCADMARVCCVLLKCLGIPCRILNLADLNRAYNGHVVCEAFYEGKYGVVDPIYGFRFDRGGPVSGYELWKHHREFSLGYDGYMDLYGAIAIHEYRVSEPHNYTVTRPNAYCARIISCDHQNRWFMGEDD